MSFIFRDSEDGSTAQNFITKNIEKTQKQREMINEFPHLFPHFQNLLL